MPYKKYARKPRRKTGAKKGVKKVSNAVKSYVQRTINRQAEHKVSATYASNISLTSCAVGFTLDALQLLPVPGQGAGGSQRIGNEIHVKNGVMKIIYNLLPYSATLNPINVPIYVRVMVLSLKTRNNTALTTTDTDQLFEIGTSSTGCQKSPLDMVLTINKQIFNLHYNKVFKLGASSMTTAGPVGSAGYYDNSPMTKMLTINWGKWVNNLKFNDTSGVPTNKNLFLCHQVVNADGSGSATTACEYHYANRSEYQDM